MKVGRDNWCPKCCDWTSFNKNGKCINCGTFIDVKTKEYSWFEKFGVEKKELENESGDF